MGVYTEILSIPPLGMVASLLGPMSAIKSSRNYESETGRGS